MNIIYILHDNYMHQNQVLTPSVDFGSCRYTGQMAPLSQAWQ